MEKNNPTPVAEGKGDGYSYRQFSERYVVSVDNRRELVSVLERVCRDFNVRGGEITGIGATDKATLRFFNPATKKYVDATFGEQMEIANLTGNVSELDGNVYLHLHVTLGRSDYSALAGHLLTATINGACEIVITKYPGALERYHNADIGLNMYLFNE